MDQRIVSLYDRFTHGGMSRRAGTQHAFNTDLGAARHDKAAADLAWSRTVAFFKEHLGAPHAA